MASCASSDTFSVFVSAFTRSGCFSNFSKYSLSTKSSPRSFRAAMRSGSAFELRLPLPMAVFARGAAGLTCAPMVFSIAWKSKRKL